jgi:hypothetical protein
MATLDPYISHVNYSITSTVTTRAGSVSTEVKPCVGVVGIECKRASFGRGDVGKQGNGRTTRYVACERLCGDLRLHLDWTAGVARSRLMGEGPNPSTTEPKVRGPATAIIATAFVITAFVLISFVLPVSRRRRHSVWR